MAQHETTPSSSQDSGPFAKFSTSFNSAYALAEEDGTAHLVCFPSCHEGGHRSGAACGEVAQVLATLPPGLNPKRVAAYAELGVDGTEGDYAAVRRAQRYTTGQVVPLQHVPRIAIALSPLSSFLCDRS